MLNKKNHIFMGIMLTLFFCFLIMGLHYTSELGCGEGSGISDEEKKIRSFHIRQYNTGSEDKSIFLCYLNPVFLNDEKLMQTSFLMMNTDKKILPGFDVYELSKMIGIGGPAHLRSYAVNRKTKEGFFIADNLERSNKAILGINITEEEKNRNAILSLDKKRAVRFNRVAMECDFNVADEKQAIQIAEKFICLSYNNEVFLANKLPAPSSAYRYIWLEYCHDHPDFSENIRGLKIRLRLKKSQMVLMMLK